MAKKAAAQNPIPQNLRRLRQQAGLTQAEVAEAADVADATISRIERGRFLPSQALLERLAEAVEASPADLLTKSKTPKKPSLRRCEARLLALVRNLDDAEVDDVGKAVKLILAVGRKSKGRR